MVALPNSTSLSKINVAVGLVAIVLYAVGGTISQWIKSDFTVLGPAPYPPVEIEAHLGLTESCSVRRVMGNVIRDRCSRDGARDWQKAASGVGFVGAVAAVAGFVLLILNVTVEKVARHHNIKYAIAALSFAAMAFMASALIIYQVERKDVPFTPDPPYIAMTVDFDIGWAYVVSACSAGFHGLLMVLALVDACSSRTVSDQAAGPDKYMVR